MGKVLCDFCFLYMLVFYVKQYISCVSIRSAVCHMDAYLLCSRAHIHLEGTTLSWWGCLSSLGGGLEPFVMEGFSRTLHHPAWTPSIIFSGTVPVLSDDIVQYRVNSLGMLGILVVFKGLKYYGVTVAGLVCWGSEMCLIWQIVCFCRDWDKVREKGGDSTSQICWRA